MQSPSEEKLFMPNVKNNKGVTWESQALALFFLEIPA